MLAPWKKSYDKPRQHIKSRHITLPTKVHIAKAMIFPVVIYGCESWTIKKAERWRINAFKLWCWKTLASPLDSKKIKPVNQRKSTLNIAEAPILWPPDAKSWLTGKDLGAGRDWKQEEKGTTEDEMVGWHHWFNRHEFDQTPGDNEGQGSLAWCSPRGRRVWTQLWNWTTTW